MHVMVFPLTDEIFSLKKDKISTIGIYNIFYIFTIKNRI